MPEEHIPSGMLPKGGNPWDGKRAPGVLNTFVVFFLFFHLALRFWNHTCTLSQCVTICYHVQKQHFYITGELLGSHGDGYENDCFWVITPCSLIVAETSV
jgi:hypothetical protein